MSYRSKEDDVNRISTSIFVTSFPDSFTAKDLFHSCKQYGHVVDSFIPVKRSKEGKRFGFVRFFNVFNVERLVSNLCTIWVNQSKFHANIARFQRPPRSNDNVNANKSNAPNRGVSHVSHKNVGDASNGNSFAEVVKSRGTVEKMEGDSSPAIVLDDECLNSKDISNALLGRVKVLASLTNLKTALSNEGFFEFGIRYMGELWVLLEFDSSESKERFQENTGVRSW
ncbi:nucleotide-binding alpha-beta plait domain-containing protein [Tanacetum coccineum]